MFRREVHDVDGDADDNALDVDVDDDNNAVENNAIGINLFVIFLKVSMILFNCKILYMILMMITALRLLQNDNYNKNSYKDIT